MLHISIPFLARDMKIATLTEKTAVTVLYLHKNVAEYLSATFMQGTKTTNRFSLLSAEGKSLFHPPWDVISVYLKAEKGKCYQALPKLLPTTASMELFPTPERKRHRGVEAQKEQEERFLLTGSHHGQKVTASAGTQSLCPHPVVKDFILHRASPVWALWSPN